MFNSQSGLRISIQSVGLPIGAGLGSSAAFSVALAGALIRMRMKLISPLELTTSACAITASSSGSSAGDLVIIREDDPESRRMYRSQLLHLINGWAYASEVVIHGAPSGLDNTTSCYGGAMKYSRIASKFQQLDQLPSMQIILTNTKVPRSTKKLVAGVRERYDAFPAIIKPILESIEAISQRFLEILDRYLNLFYAVFGGVFFMHEPPFALVILLRAVPVN